MAGLTLSLALIAFGSPDQAWSQTKAARPHTKALFFDITGSGRDDITVYLTPQGVRIDNAKRHYGIISKAPDWNVMVWSDTKKTLSQVSHHDWCYKYAFHSASWPCDLKASIGKKKTRVAGTDLTVYDFGSTPIVSVGMFRGNYGREDNTDEINRAEIAMMDYPNSDKTGPVVGRLQMLPILPGFPMFARRHRANGNIEGALFTRKMETVDLPENAFKTPAYKEVPFNKKVLEDAVEDRRTQDFFKEFLSPETK